MLLEPPAPAGGGMSSGLESWPPPVLGGNSINAMASNGGPSSADIGTDEPRGVEEKLASPVVGDPEHKIRLGSWDHGAGGETLEVLKEQGGRDGVAEQEINGIALWDNRSGECPVIGHQESDVGLEEIKGCHVDKHHEGEVVGFLHLFNGYKDIRAS
nr:hypothetical protein Iba_scaffold11320CG0010 [Ipomoea batatas]